MLCGLLFSAEYAPNRIIIKLKNTTSVQAVGAVTTVQKLPESIRNLSESQGVSEIRALAPETKVSGMRKITSGANTDAYGLSRIYVLDFATTINPVLVAALYANDPNIQYAEPDYVRRICVTTPNDTYYLSDQANDSMRLIDAERGWDIATGNNSVIIAIMDTGVSLNHPDLTIWTNPLGSSGPPYVGDLHGWNFYANNNDVNDDNNYALYQGVTYNAFGHGTQCAGHAAAIGNNGLGVTGVAWRATIMPLKICNAGGDSFASNIIAALDYARSHGASVVNMSFSGGGSSQAEQDACNAAYASGVLLVAAMGNGGGPNVNYPAGYESVIRVGAVRHNGDITRYSDYGAGSQTTELVAPGGDNGEISGSLDVLSTCAFTTGLVGGIGGQCTKWPQPYNAGSGTSFAAPKVAGLCALMKSFHPELTNDKIRQALHNSATDLGDVGYDKRYGFGLINVYRALALLSAYASANPAKLQDVYNFPNPVINGRTKFSFRSEKLIKSATWTIYDLRGRTVAILESNKGSTTSGGSFISGDWDCTDDQGNKLANGTYLYVVKAMDANDLETYAKGKLTIVN